MIYKIYSAILILLNAFRFFKKRPEIHTFAEVENPMSEKIQITLECSKEMTELGQGLAKFLAAVKLAMADGFQAGADIPPIISAAVADLVPAVNGVTLIKDEYADKKAFMNAVAVVGAAVAGALL
jgi:hypothetical protein